MGDDDDDFSDDDSIVTVEDLGITDDPWGLGEDGSDGEAGAMDTGTEDSTGNAVFQNPDGTFTTYDSDGNPVANYDSQGNITQNLTQDDVGSDPLPGSAAGGNNALIETYSDGQGNTVQVTRDSSGNLIYQTVDASGNLVSETDANGTSLIGGANTTPGNVGTGSAGGGSGGGSSGGSLPGGGSGSSSSNSQQLQALQNQLQALANALQAAQQGTTTLPPQTIAALQTRAGIVNGQIANLGGVPSSLFPTTGASLLSGNTTGLLVIGAVAIGAILLLRRPYPSPMSQAA